MNLIAFYLPQYHTIPENDEWWGKDYTEWDSLKRGEKLIEDQYQPRIPLNNNYYNLSDVEVMRWQYKIAQKFGVYGFCVYHYWFNGKLLLQKPMEQLLERKDIDFRFFFCWANEDWTNIWEGNLSEIKVLISNSYDDEGLWVKHFEYFLPFFKDHRYIKENNKPLLVIYNPLLIRKLKKMIECWNSMAIEAGFDGIVFMYQTGKTLLSNDSRKELFDYGIEYYPGLAALGNQKSNQIRLNNKIHDMGSLLRRKLGIQFHKRMNENLMSKKTIKEIENYDNVWKYIITRDVNDKTVIPGAFVDWDNTPRKKYAGKVILGATPEKFKAYLIKQIERARAVYKKNMIFIFAWNEWSEGGYLEPDERYEYKYLEAVYNALSQTNELPNNAVSFSIEYPQMDC